MLSRKPEINHSKVCPLVVLCGPGQRSEVLSNVSFAAVSGVVKKQPRFTTQPKAPFRPRLVGVSRDAESKT